MYLTLLISCNRNYDTYFNFSSHYEAIAADRKEFRALHDYDYAACRCLMPTGPTASNIIRWKDSIFKRLGKVFIPNYHII